MSKTSNYMHLFIGWRPMEDRLGPIAYAIEYCLWGDGRARHTFLLASTAEHPLVLIEINVGNIEKGIRKSMTLNITELKEIPKTFKQIEFIGRIQSPTALKDLIQSAYNYVLSHSNYYVLGNNCRTFVEYLINQIPEFSNLIRRKNGSILDYYHKKAKDEHPGLLIKLIKFSKRLKNLY